MVKGKLEHQSTDVIVSPSDQMLRLTDPQAKAIAEVTGQEMVTECKKIIERRG